MALNRVTLLGFVGQAPKIETLNNGSKVATFSLATTEKGYTTANGTKVQDRTDWHNIVAWGKLADIIEKFVGKGSQIYLEGKLRTRSYTDKSGVNRYVTEIQADNIHLLNYKQQSAPDNNETIQASIDNADYLPF